ncbi:MAG: hypothetical protein Q9227_009291 [Pyrenula ochraceoflavens]
MSFSEVQTVPGADYIPPSPPAGNQPHRYVALVYSQPASFSVPAAFSSINPPSDNKARLGFDINAFMSAANLQPPVAGNYFTVVNDGSAPQGGAANGTGTGTGTGEGAGAGAGGAGATASASAEGSTGTSVTVTGGAAGESASATASAGASGSAAPFQGGAAPAMDGGLRKVVVAWVVGMVGVGVAVVL